MESTLPPPIHPPKKYLKFIKCRSQRERYKCNGSKGIKIKNSKAIYLFILHATTMHNRLIYIYIYATYGNWYNLHAVILNSLDLWERQLLERMVLVLWLRFFKSSSFSTLFFPSTDDKETWLFPKRRKRRRRGRRVFVGGCGGEVAWAAIVGWGNWNWAWREESYIH